MKKKLMSFLSAHRLVKTARPIICPNWGFTS